MSDITPPPPDQAPEVDLAVLPEVHQTMARRMFLGLGIPAGLLAVVIALFSPALALFYAVGMAVVIATLVRTRIRRTVGRLVLGPDGVRFEGGTHTVVAPWSAVVSVQEVAWPVQGEAASLVLDDASHVTWTRGTEVAAWLDQAGLGRYIPLTFFTRAWRSGPVGEALARWAPHVLEDAEGPEAPADPADPP